MDEIGDLEIGAVDDDAMEVTTHIPIDLDFSGADLSQATVKDLFEAVASVIGMEPLSIAYGGERLRDPGILLIDLGFGVVDRVHAELLAEDVAMLEHQAGDQNIVVEEPFPSAQTPLTPSAFAPTAWSSPPGRNPPPIPLVP